MSSRNVRLRKALHAAMALSLLLQPTMAMAQTAPAAGPPAATAEVDPFLYKPVDKDERGLWMQVDEAEREYRTSPKVIRDPALNAYVRSVLCKVATEARCKHIRLYLVRTPYFNASMAPNGMMEIWSGLLLRTQNEAQLAAVLGHEYTHFQERHSVKLFRDIKSKTNSAGFLSLIPYAGILSLGILASVFSFSREMEREADTGGLKMMDAAGYDTREAAKVWERLRAEMDATAAARKTKSRKDKNGGMFATHPPSAERVTNLTKLAESQPGVLGANGADSYAKGMAAFWPIFVDDQLKMNDFGASEFLLGSLAQTGWTPALLYARGELYRRRGAAGDLEKAVEFYGQAVTGGGDIAEVWRGRGLALLKLGQAEGGKADLKEYLRRSPDAGDYAMIAMMAGG